MISKYLKEDLPYIELQKNRRSKIKIHVYTSLCFRSMEGKYSRTFKSNLWKVLPIHLERNIARSDGLADYMSNNYDKKI